MRYFNASQAAKYIEVDDKTIRRWLKAGRITAERTASGWLKIPEAEVERLRIEVAQERSQFSESKHTHEILGMPGHSEDNPDIIARLEALEQQVAELRIIVMSRHTQPFPDISPTPPPPPLYRYITDREETVTHKPSIRSSQPSLPPADIPEGSMLFADFAKLHGVHRATFWRHCTQGIQGDRVETIERPKPGGRTGDVERWLSPEQQRSAIAFWERHGVRFDP